MDDIIRTSVRLPARLLKELGDIAKRERRSVNYMIETAVASLCHQRGAPSPNGSPPQPYMFSNIPPLSLTPSSTLVVEEVASPGPVVVEVMPPRRARAARGSRLPDGWVPSDDGAELCRSRGLDPQETLDRFRDYWAAMPGVKGSKLDWEATWRNWCRNERARPKAASPLLNGLEGTYDD